VWTNENDAREAMNWGNSSIFERCKNAADACYTIVIVPDVFKITAVRSDGLRIVSTLVAGWASPRGHIKLVVSFSIRSC
jgi:hypothetical protein